MPKPRTPPYKGKRKTSDQSPLSGSKTEKKIDSNSTPPKSAFKVIPPVFDQAMAPSTQDELLRLMKVQMEVMTEVKAQVSTITTDLARIDTENKALITLNTAAIRGLDDAFKSKASRDDDRFEAIEESVSQLTDLMQNGSTLTMDPASKIEAAHEKQLQQTINDSNFCVTVLGHGEEDLSLQKLTNLITQHGYHLDGKSQLKLVGLQRLGALTTQAPYRLTLDSPITATALVEQSKSKSRAANGNITHIRFVRHFPQAYANSSRDFRQMASLLYDKGAHASVEYEGTTLTLKGKSMQAGGEWVIVPGGEFRPLVVGRQVAPEFEDPALTRARNLLGDALDNGKDSPLAKSLNLHTELNLGEIPEVKTLLGPTISEGLIGVSPAAARRGSSAKYLLSYTSRDHAKKALEASKKKDTISDLGKEKSFLTLYLPVVAP